MLLKGSNYLVFCVEDDKNIRELIIYTLKTVGYDATGFCDGKELFNQLKTKIPKIILLDIMLPNQDGLSILSALKQSPNTKDIPVILITAKSSEFDKVKGLDLGADDYITKPFGMMEMLSRVKAVLRRSEKQETTHVITCRDISIDKKKHSVLLYGSEITLPFKEYQLLKTLMENRGIVLTRDDLLNKIWGYDYDGENRTVDVHIRSLRQKLGDNSNVIQTIRNVGYKISE